MRRPPSGDWRGERPLLEEPPFDSPDLEGGCPDFGSPHRASEPTGGRAPVTKGRGCRGEVRQSILALLAERPMNGYQLIVTIAERTDGLWRPGAGSVYPALNLLTDQGLVTEFRLDGRRLHHLTDAGRRHVDEHSDQLVSPWDRVTQPHRRMLDVRPDLDKLNAAIGQVVATDDPQAMDAARAVLIEARRRIYQILADLPG